VDIGAYDTCLFACRYCYATRRPEIARQAHAAHDAEDTILFRPPHLLHRELGG
jgi:DNA repair photolyase